MSVRENTGKRRRRKRKKKKKKKGGWWWWMKYTEIRLVREKAQKTKGNGKGRSHTSISMRATINTTPLSRPDGELLSRQAGRQAERERERE